MSWAAVIAGGVALAGSAVNASGAKKQMSQAELMATRDPGYQGNPALQENARILGDRFSNYQLPGYSAARENIDRAGEMGYRSALQGATSSSDILDAATRIAYGSQMSANNLATQQAAGEERALMDYLTANQLAGQEIQDANRWDRDQYLRDQTRATELTNTGLINQNNAIQSGLGAIGSLATYKLGQPAYVSPYGQNNITNNNPGYINSVAPGAMVQYDPNILATQGYTKRIPYNNNPYIPQTL